MVASFAELPIIEPIQSALKAEGYTVPTPIQAGVIPPLLEGRDLLGCAQTGTGKTAAFAIPILQLLHGSPGKANPGQPRALVLAPTRELAVQITESFETYGKSLRLRFTSVFGGVGQGAQVNALSRGVHVLIATPGRLLDLMEQGYLSLNKLEYFVLDEADRMLDMGFMPSLKRIISQLPKKRQSVFLSATMPPPIEELAGQLLHNHVTVMITPPATTAQRVSQRVLFVDKDNKRKLLEGLLKNKSFSRVLVFVKTKHGADRLAKALRTDGMAIDAIHGNKSQGARQRVLNEFRDGKLRVLVATDVAARGIDVEGISHVVNYDIPREPDSYVHRIGRTARAGATGESISMCEGEELVLLRDIEKEIGNRIPVDRQHPFHSPDAEDEVLQREMARKESRSNAKGSVVRRGSGGKAPAGGSSRSPNKKGATATTSRRRSISGKVKKVKQLPPKPEYGFGHGIASGESSAPKKRSTARPAKKRPRR